MPEQFVKIMNDFLTDILNTFPEYKDNLSESEISILNKDMSNNDLFLYCCSVYPARFFDILYKNEDMFENEEINTCFLPDMDFKHFFNENITEKPKKQFGSIYKLYYLLYQINLPKQIHLVILPNYLKLLMKMNSKIKWKTP